MSVEQRLLLACKRACDVLAPTNPARGMNDDLLAAREIRFLVDELTVESCSAALALAHVLKTSSSVEVCLTIRETAKVYIDAFQTLEAEALKKADGLC